MHGIALLYSVIIAVVARARISLGRTNTITVRRNQVLSDYPLLTVDSGAIITFPTAFPPWSISPSPVLTTSSKSHTHPAVIAGSVVGGLALFIIIAVAAFKIVVTVRRRLPDPSRRYNRKWHIMETRKRRGVCTSPAAPVSESLAYHDTATAPQSVQNHTLHIAPSDGRKQFLFPMTPLSKIYNQRRLSDSPYDQFGNPGALTTGNYQRLPSYNF